MTQWLTKFQQELAAEGYQCEAYGHRQYDKVETICPKGHHYVTSYRNWRKGRRCSYCKGNYLKNRREDFLQLIQKTDFKIEEEIPSALKTAQNVKLSCPKGHHFTKNYISLKSSLKCPYCIGSKVDYQPFVKEVESRGYSFVETPKDWKNKSRFALKCPKGHEYETTYNRWNNDGYRCPYCAGQIVDYSLLQEELENKGYQVLEPFTNFKTKVRVKCPKGHSWLANPKAWGEGYRCKRCAELATTSKAEEELREELESFGVKVVPSYRPDWLNTQELDLYLPDHKLAIEMNGIYWHSEKFRDKHYHLRKLKLCQEQGVQLIQVLDYEWIYRKDQVLNFIESKLGVNKRIYARNCQFRESANASSFLDSYHIQGSVSASFHFGLYYRDELIQLMSFGKHHRQNSNDWLLSRMCTKRGFQVIGGASKLFRNSINKIRVNSISTFADLRYSEGNVYQALGFDEVSRLRPDYFYTRNGQKFSKQSLKKTPEERSLGKTEHELRLGQGYLRVYDCGKIKYKFSV